MRAIARYLPGPTTLGTDLVLSELGGGWPFAGQPSSHELRPGSLRAIPILDGAGDRKQGRRSDDASHYFDNPALDPLLCVVSRGLVGNTRVFTRISRMHTCRTLNEAATAGLT